MVEKEEKARRHALPKLNEVFPVMIKHVENRVPNARRDKLRWFPANSFTLALNKHCCLFPLILFKADTERMKQNSSTDCLCNCCLQILGRKSLFSSYQHIALSITSVHASIRAYLLFTGPTLFLQNPGSEAGGRRGNETSFVQHSRCNGCVPFSLSH